MTETLRHLDLAINALRTTHPAHRLLKELEQSRRAIMRMEKITPHMFAEYRE